MRIQDWKRQMCKKMRGFTLIELLIVIAIVLILVAIALPNFLEAQLRAKVTSARACLHTYWVAQGAYYTDFNIHAPDVDGGEREQNSGQLWSSLLARAGVSCPGEFCTYRVLTTPIKYITEVCYDPLLTQYHEDALKGIAVPEYTSIYAAANPAFRIAQGKRFNLTYIMLFQGPDHDRDVDGFDNVWSTLGSGLVHRFNNPAIYSPTNGTKSNGDLVTSNRGHEPVR